MGRWLHPRGNVDIFSPFPSKLRLSLVLFDFIHELSEQQVSCVSLHVSLHDVQVACGVVCCQYNQDYRANFFSSKTINLRQYVTHTVHHFLNTSPVLRECKPFFNITVQQLKPHIIICIVYSVFGDGIIIRGFWLPHSASLKLFY